MCVHSPVSSQTCFLANSICSVCVYSAPVGNQIILFDICFVWPPLALCVSVCLWLPGTTPCFVSPSLSAFQMREEIRQDTVYGDKEFCLFKTHSPKRENRPLVAPKRKSEVTLKTIGPLPVHSASLHLPPLLFLLPSLSTLQDASAACLRADGRDKDGLGE